ncbi:DUF2213 domain-containing protein [Salmonella enterica subsp. enterica serovar Cerro]|nr:DUF2213 domain-containing protein [Salmonella enterica subsp. enterica serovar Cerro]
MKKDYRIDKGGRITSKVDDNGYLRIDGVVAHVGILEYMDDDGTVIREFVPEETLFDPASLSSLAGAPVTLQHPPEMVTPSNYKEYSQGSVNGMPKRDGDNLVASMLVIGNEALHAVEYGGVSELSPGYSVDLDETPGEWQGQKYDRVQRNRRYNHQAIVDAARGGSICSLRFDGANVPNNEDNSMTQIKLPGGGTVEVADAATAATINAALAKQGKRLDSTKGQLKKLVKAIAPKLKLDADDIVKDAEDENKDEVVEVDVPAVEEAVTSVSTAVDTLQAQLDELADAVNAGVDTGPMDADPEDNKDADPDADPEQKTDALSKMLYIVEAAKKLKPGISHMDGKRVKTAREIQVEALIAAKSGFNADGKSDAYISGRFDAAVDGLKNRTDSLRTQRQGLNLDGVFNSREESGQAAYNAKFYAGKA